MKLKDISLDKLKELVRAHTSDELVDIVLKYIDKPLDIEAFSSMRREIEAKGNEVYPPDYDWPNDGPYDEDIDVDNAWMVCMNIANIKRYEDNGADVVVLDLNGLEPNNRGWFPDTRFDLPWATVYDRHETKHREANVKLLSNLLKEEVE